MQYEVKTVKKVGVGKYEDEINNIIPQAMAAIKLKKNHPIRRCTCYNALIRYLCTNPSGTKFPCKHSYERMIL